MAFPQATVLNRSYPPWVYRLVPLALLLLAAGLAVLARARVDDPNSTTADLQVFLGGGTAVRTGQDPYLFQLPGSGLGLVYPPFAALLMAPLSLLSLSVLRIVWFIGIVVALQAVVWLATGWVGPRDTRPRVLLTVAASALPLLIDPIWQELWSGQVNLFLTLLVVADLCRRDGARGRGIAIGIAAGIKLTPGLFIVYLALTRRTREAVTALVTFAATVALGFATMPRAAWHYWTGYLWDVDRVFQGAAIVFNQSLRGMLARLTHSEDVLLPWALVAAVVVILGLAVCVGLSGRGHEVEAAALCGITALLVSPISWVYHWVWLVPVLAVLIAGAVRTRSPAWITATVLTAAVAIVHPYTWVGGVNAVPSGLAGGYRGWWPTWTGFSVSPSGLGPQLLANSLVLVGLVLLAGGAALLWTGPARQPDLTASDQG